MDNAKLVTIAVTALITVTVTEVAKAVLAWLKITAVSDTNKQRARLIFSKRNRAIIWNSLWFAGTSADFIKHIRSTAPITRGDIVVIPLMMFAALFWFMSLIFSLIERFRSPS